jgi:hypothetical protein
MARPIRDHKARHDRYLKAIAKRHSESGKAGHLVANAWYDLGENVFRDPEAAGHPRGKPTEAFYEYDLVCFKGASEGDDLGIPMWFAEFTAKDQWDRSKFIYEAWRWIWFGNRLHAYMGLPAQGWAWIPGVKTSVRRLSNQVTDTNATFGGPDPRERPFIYYVLEGIPLHSIWMAGIDGEGHALRFANVGAIPPNIAIKMEAPNQFEVDVLGSAGSFGQAYRGTRKGTRGR